MWLVAMCNSKQVDPECAHRTKCCQAAVPSPSWSLVIRNWTFLYLGSPSAHLSYNLTELRAKVLLDFWICHFRHQIFCCIANPFNFALFLTMSVKPLGPHRGDFD